MKRRTTVFIFVRINFNSSNDFFMIPPQLLIMSNVSDFNGHFHNLQESTSKFAQSSWTAKKSNCKYGTQPAKNDFEQLPLPITEAQWASC